MSSTDRAAQHLSHQQDYPWQLPQGHSHFLSLGLGELLAGFLCPAQCFAVQSDIAEASVLALIFFSMSSLWIPAL